MLTLNQWRSFLARSVYVFFLNGTLKSYGVILMDIVKKLDSKHYLVGWAFTLQTGAGYLICKYTTKCVCVCVCKYMDEVGRRERVWG